MIREEMKALFLEHYTQEYLDLKEAQVEGYTEMAFAVFCNAYYAGYKRGVSDGQWESRR